MLLRQRPARQCVCIRERRMEIQSSSVCIKALWWVCVWLQVMANVCVWGNEHEQTQAAPVSIFYVFVREGSKKQPGEKDWKNQVGMIRHLHGWTKSSTREEIQASGKSFKAILICFGGEKKQMHWATAKWLWQQLQSLDFTYLFLF